jgi:hypothetical protein
MSRVCLILLARGAELARRAAFARAIAPETNRNDRSDFRWARSAPEAAVVRRTGIEMRVVLNRKEVAYATRGFV